MQVTWNSGRLWDAGFFFFFENCNCCSKLCHIWFILNQCFNHHHCDWHHYKMTIKSRVWMKNTSLLQSHHFTCSRSILLSHSPSPHGQFLMNRNLLPCLACHTPQPCWLVLPVTSALDFTLDMWQAESGMLIYYKITTEITPLRQTKL